MSSKKLAEKLRQRQKDIKSRSSGGKFFSIKEGVTRMRPLPVGDDEEFAFETTYFYLGKDIGGVISPVTFGQRCAIMEKYQELSNSKKDSDREFAKRFKPGTKFFSPHIKYKDEDGKEIDESGAKLLILTGSQYNQLIDFFLDKELGDFTDPVNGYDIKYRRTGKGRNDTEYTLTNCRPTKLSKKYNKVYNPEEMVKELVPSYKETKELLEKFLSAPEESAAEEEAPRKKKKKDRGDV